MTTLIIVRHAETEANVQQVWQGTLDAPLTRRGQKQVMATAQHMAHLVQKSPVDRFYVSPLPRAQRTAAGIATAIGMTPVIEEGLREFDLGDWEGRTFQALKDAENLWERWAVEPTFAPPNGESAASFGQRAVDIMVELADRHLGETVLIVTHGGLICNVLARWLGEGPQDWRNWEPHNCAITMLARATNDAAGGWTPTLVNSIQHLPAAARTTEDKSVYAVAEAQSERE